MNGEETQFHEMFLSFGPNSKDVLREDCKLFMHPNKLIKPDLN